MTGNMVLLGLSAGSGHAELAVPRASPTARLAPAAPPGARLVGSAQPDDPVWPRQVTRALVLELSVFLVFLVVWEVSPPSRSAHVGLGLLMLSAAALGVQSS